MKENRLDSIFARLRAQRRAAFIAYLTAGDPSLAQTPELVWALERAGANVVELGIPFSDPLADGLVNQLSAQRALAAGATPAGVLEAVRQVRVRSQIPLVLYTYFNLLYAYGLDRFCLQAHAAGVDGLLILDLPPEETDGPHGVPLHWAGGELRRICLVAPTTPPERVERIVKSAGGFLYYVSRAGVTGMRSSVADGIPARVAALRQVTPLPICVGFGISTPEQAEAVARQADGVVVGSALVNFIAETAGASDLANRLENFARPLAQAIHGALPVS